MLLLVGSLCVASTALTESAFMTQGVTKATDKKESCKEMKKP